MPSAADPEVWKERRYFDGYRTWALDAESR
jgi:hypothetical protein